MREEHLNTVLQFNPTTQSYLCGYFSLTNLGSELPTAGLGQADIVLALLRGPATLHGAVEALVGRPVQRLPPREVRPLPAALPPPEVPAADRRRVKSVAPNPRLPTTPSFQRFREFRVGRTVHQCLSRGVTRRDLREALREGWVVLEDAL